MLWIRRYWPFLILVLAPLLPLWKAVFLGQAIGPFDQIRQMAPWNGPRPAQPWDVLQADGVLQFYPWRDLVLEAWREGRVPFWNPYELAGTPLLANSQSAGLYPPHILMGVLHVPTAAAMTLLAWLHLAWAALGTYFLTRKLGASRVGGVIAGLSFCLSAFMVSWTGLPSVITTCSWIPWLLGLTLQLFRSEYSRPMKLRDTALLAVCVGMMILAGHLQFVAYGGMAALILAVWLSVSDLGLIKETAPADKVRSEMRTGMNVALRRFGLFVAASALGAAIAAPQLLPVLEYSKFSHRRNQPTEAGYLGYQASAIQPFELVGVMHPNLVGSPSEAQRAFEYNVPLPSYWPGYVKQGANFAEGAIGVGPLVLGLLLLGRRRFDFRRWGGISLIGALAFLLATGTAAGRLLYYGVPGWSSTGSPGRIAVLFVLAMCVLAGVTATQDPEPEPPLKWRLYVPIAGMAIIAILSIYGVMFALGDLKPAGDWSSAAIPPLIAAGTATPKALAAISTLIAAAAIGYWLKKQRQPSWALLIAAVAVYFLSVPQVLRFGDPDLRYQSPVPKYERVATMNHGWALMTAAQQAVLPPNTGSLSRIHELGGYDSLLHRDTVALIDTIDRHPQYGPFPLANGNMVFVTPNADLAQLSDAGVSVLWRPDDIVPVPNAKGRAYTPAGRADITSENASELVLKANGPGKLTLTDRNMPGWTAKVDGKETPISGELWREVELPEGNHEVRFEYVAPGYQTGLMLALLAWLLTGGIFVVAWRRMRETAPAVG